MVVTQSRVSEGAAQFRKEERNTDRMASPMHEKKYIHTVMSYRSLWRWLHTHDSVCNVELHVATNKRAVRQKQQADDGKKLQLSGVIV